MAGMSHTSVQPAPAVVAAEPGIKQKSPEEVRNLLFRRFQISYVESVQPQNVKITRQNGYQMQIAYEVRRNLMYNLDFVAVFDKTVELGGGSGD